MQTLADLFVGKNNNLTFIRLVAALSVIYGHTSAIVYGAPADWVAVTTGYAFLGGVAVDLFFLISGFLVTASILNGGVKNYVVSRILRIYPALWVNLILVTFVLGSMVTTLSVSEYIIHEDVWTYFIGLAFTYKGGFFLHGVFTQNHNQAVNGSIWSVLIEVWLYIVVAFFYIFRIMRSRAIFNKVFFKSCFIDDGIIINRKQSCEFIDSQSDLFEMLNEINKYQQRSSVVPDWLIETILDKLKIYNFNL